MPTSVSLCTPLEGLKLPEDDRMEGVHSNTPQHLHFEASDAHLCVSLWTPLVGPKLPEDDRMEGVQRATLATSSLCGI
jgi:hypothetical protein